MQKNKWLIVILIIPLFFGLLPADQQQEEEKKEEEQEQETVTQRKDPFFKALWQDEKDIWTSPFRMKGKDLLKWGAVALVTGVLIHNDVDIYRDIKEYQAEHEWVDKVSPHLSKFAQGIPFGIAGLMWAYGAIVKDGKAKETGVLALQAMIHSFVVIQMIKHLTGRARPSAFNGEDRWAGPSGFFKRYEEGKWSHYDAFASGHTITIWALATVVAHQYRNNFLVGFLSYSLATLSGMATVTEDLHWVSDVFLGAVLGYSIARFVVKKRSSRFNVLPMVSGDKVGLSFYYVF